MKLFNLNNVIDPGTDLNCLARREPIEIGILPLCDTLNAIPGVSTLWSCEGHVYNGCFPYVIFLTCQETAHQLWSLLNDTKFLKTLSYNWVLEGLFRTDGELQYCLKVSDYRLDKFKYSVLKFGGTEIRHRLDRDIQTISAHFCHYHFDGISL